MNTPKTKTWTMGIMARTALLSWLVTSGTLLIFVTAIIPEQKRIFQENLQSKAHSVAVSVKDVSAGAAVNEDYSDVVLHCLGLMDGDRSIDYLVITKQDGTSQVFQQGSPRWSPETLNAPWRPEKREPSSGIGVVPLFNRRVFYYSQPFDYSGIEWGWMHVGLSLDAYDRSVAAVYRRTSVLAILCVSLSLAASVLYAKRLVRPILRLRTVVQQVADGDLSARAEVGGGDELSSLAHSVNAMTQALLQRDQILQSVRFAAQQFLSTSHWKDVIADVLAKIGSAAVVSRIRVFEALPSAAGPEQFALRCQWVRAGHRPQADPADTPAFILNASDFASWREPLQRGEIVAADIDELDPVPRRVLEPHGVKSFLAIPILVERTLWGVLTLAECERLRRWTDAERDSIRAAADMLGAAVVRQRAQDALLEAKETLEHRVDERTKELREQVADKERARSELAQAQQRLMALSRQAGMAEVATGVLHNVGNVLNSVNVSADLIRERLRDSALDDLFRTAALLRAHEHDMAAFLGNDPKGRLVPGFLIALAEHLQAELKSLQDEARGLVKNVEHIKDIVAMQQTYARVAGVIETLSPRALVEDALHLQEAGLETHHIRVQRKFEDVPDVAVDKHKLLQILINLIRNARHSLDHSSASEKCLSLGLQRQGPDRIRITVKDNGVGIPPQNLTKIFSHGFTTKRDGHGFGLHSGALAAKEMGGALTAHSDGVDRGALFALELPVARPRPGPDTPSSSSVCAEGPGSMSGS